MVGTAFSSLAAMVLFAVLLSSPVWLASRVVGADHPTLLRSGCALVVGTALAALAVAVAGGFGVLLAPLAFLLAFKRILGTSYSGAFMLAVVAAGGYFALAQVMGGSISFAF